MSGRVRVRQPDGRLSGYRKTQRRQGPKRCACVQYAPKKTQQLDLFSKTLRR
jgi:hypothetical protein